MPPDDPRRLARLSPFELKDRLVAEAAEHARRSTQVLLDAGRGNPDWAALAPREAFFRLGEFALAESRRAGRGPAFGGLPTAPGIASRFEGFLSGCAGTEGVRLLREGVAFAVGELGCEPDALVLEWCDGVLGDHYPMPVRMLRHAHRVAGAYVARELFGAEHAPRIDLFATEGATAAMCYVFHALVANGLLAGGDTIAIGAPIFTPYLEIPRLPEYAFRVVEITAAEDLAWQYPDAEIDKLTDPAIKVFVLVNPGNPTAVAVGAHARARLVDLVRSRRPDLIILTDDVYATFVDGFRSLAASLPENTIALYSFSKYFGCTGWRLGLVALAAVNVVDRAIAAMPADERAARAARYAAIAVEPERLAFIDRMAADSRKVALNHTAGLSTPQQIQMTLFALAGLLDRAHAYKHAAQAIVRQRHDALWRGLGDHHRHAPGYTSYYETIDLERWMLGRFGPEFVAYMKAKRHPLEVLLRLAERFSTVLLPGAGFDAPDWSVRVSLANLPDQTYERLGDNLEAVLQSFRDEWAAASGTDAGQG